MFLAKYREERIKFHSRPGPNYEILASEIVFSGPGRTLPLLRIKTCTTRCANGNCGVSTFLLAYDRGAQRFRVDFFNMMGRNNNEEARFVENGLLAGSVVVAYPSDNAPFTYFVEVYKRSSDSDYVQVLRYRGNTHYGDGNPLAVIDSEMPETLRRLGLWKAESVARPAENASRMYARDTQRCRMVWNPLVLPFGPLMANRQLSDFGPISRAESILVVWLPGMDSNHMVDRFWICCSLLISKVTEVAKRIKSKHLVQNRYIGNSQNSRGKKQRQPLRRSGIVLY